ncbi:ABC transporter permease [Gluconacetobacter johannae]|uniref:ABC transporter permease n=1 Tax=Gluconacetobacter johannae TaxID=112140 RepID=A0A7W4P260_9PROT|nr:ABC transporter permease [Gluconacetobacter johannae]MBB2174791.1 ABC transporter permease [Gluconacetobacter johannae]
MSILPEIPAPDGMCRPPTAPSAPRPVRPVVAALRDIGAGLAMWRLALSLGWLDIRLRYRGSALGPFWLTLSSAVMIGAMGVIYGRLFHMDLRGYLPYLALSMILWQVGVGAVLAEACTCFTDAERTIRSVRLPFFLQAMRLMVRNAIVFGHNIVVPLGVFLLFGIWHGAAMLLAAPGVALWLVDGLASALLLGSICARFRDIPPIVGSVVQVAFYVTPVMWSASQLKGRDWWFELNPFYPLLEVVRGPLLGQVPAPRIWAEAGVSSALLCLVALYVFSRSRSQLAFWV